MRRIILTTSLLAAACGAASTDERSVAPTGASNERAPLAELRVVPVGEIPRSEPTPLPDGVSRWAVSAGWGDTYFVSRSDEGRVDRVQGDESAVLVSGLDHPGALLVDGGQLVVAARDGLFAVALASGEPAPLAEVAGVTSLALDHVGYYLASRADAPPARVTPAGEVTELEGVPAGPLAFDPETRELFVVDEASGEAKVFDYVRVVGEDPALWAARDRRAMRPFVLGEVGLTSAEYWPNRGDTPTRYPEDVLWGFYPEEGVVFEGVASPASATPEAIACAEQSYRALHDFLTDPPPTLLRAIALGTSNRFYLWVNDYTEASDPFPEELRPSRMWYWRRDPAVAGRIPGYWKWETTLTQSGECRIPERDQALAYLEEKIEELRRDAP